MNTPDEQFDYERGESELSRRYRELKSVEVPRALDDAILAQARGEIQKTNRSRRWRQWTAPVALAASAVLAMSLVFRSGVQREAPMMMQAPQSSAPSTADSQVPASQLAGEPISKDEVNAESENAPVAKVVAQPRVAPTAPRTLGASSSLEKPIRQKLEAAPVPPSMPSASQFAMAREERIAASRPTDLADQCSAEAADSVAHTAAPAPSEFELKKAAANVDRSDTAERWLTEIRKLRAQGHNDKADQQWREFRKTFPNYTVPADDAARPKP